MSTLNLQDKPALIARIEQLEAAQQRVRELHASEGTFYLECRTCADANGHALDYPCPTIKALEGDQ